MLEWLIFVAGFLFGIGVIAAVALLKHSDEAKVKVMARHINDLKLAEARTKLITIRDAAKTIAIAQAIAKSAIKSIDK